MLERQNGLDLLAIVKGGRLEYPSNAGISRQPDSEFPDTLTQVQGPANKNRRWRGRPFPAVKTLRHSGNGVKLATSPVVVHSIQGPVGEQRQLGGPQFGSREDRLEGSKCADASVVRLELLKNGATAGAQTRVQG